MYPKIICKTESISDHPWVFRMHLREPDAPVRNGDIADLFAPSGRFLARGFYNGHARVGFRVLTRQADQQIDQDFFDRAIDRCVRFRRDFLQLDAQGNAYRLVNSEGDGLSGLIVDRYDDMLVLEFFAAGMYQCRELIVNALRGYLPDSRFFWFAEAHVQKQESFNCVYVGAAPVGEVEEHGVKFAIDCALKHKTGFYADQRDNRLALAKLVADKSVLDLCSFAGGFALAAKINGRAKKVVAVEMDASAVELGRRNAGLNAADIEFVQQSFQDYLATCDQRFDVVIFDPPKQTKNKDDLQNALRRYAQYNRQVLTAVAPGGVLVTCSCSGLVDEPEFLRALRRAAADAGRFVKIIKISGAGPDHPFAASAPEGRYLKVIWAVVE